MRDVPHPVQHLRQSQAPVHPPWKPACSIITIQLIHTFNSRASATPPCAPAGASPAVRRTLLGWDLHEHSRSPATARTKPCPRSPPTPLRHAVQRPSSSSPQGRPCPRPCLQTHLNLAQTQPPPSPSTHPHVRQAHGLERVHAPHLRQQRPLRRRRLALCRPQRLSARRLRLNCSQRRRLCCRPLPVSSVAAGAPAGGLVTPAAGGQQPSPQRNILRTQRLRGWVTRTPGL